MVTTEETIRLSPRFERLTRLGSRERTPSGTPTVCGLAPAG